MAKLDYFLTLKDFKEVLDEIILLCKELESSEAKLSMMESAVVEKKAFRAKHF